MGEPAPSAGCLGRGPALPSRRNAREDAAGGDELSDWPRSRAELSLTRQVQGFMGAGNPLCAFSGREGEALGLHPRVHVCRPRVSGSALGSCSGPYEPPPAWHPRAPGSTLRQQGRGSPPPRPQIASGDGALPSRTPGRGRQWRVSAAPRKAPQPALVELPAFGTAPPWSPGACWAAPPLCSEAGQGLATALAVGRVQGVGTVLEWPLHPRMVGAGTALRGGGEASTFLVHSHPFPTPAVKGCRCSSEPAFPSQQTLSRGKPELREGRLMQCVRSRGGVLGAPP